ncbi:hypothetical protein LTR85_010768 [Meristemomyces frigidus]|nr:hypothetical protein LTR85_010768 [Meristemomyces frigidus]
MASKRGCIAAIQLPHGLRASQRTAQRCLVRGMATEAPLPNATLAQTYIDAHLDSAPTESILKDQVAIPPATPSSSQHTTPQPYQRPQNPFLSTASCTTHTFPTFEPTNFVSYPSTHLLLPLRKDLLHRAVIFEGDMTRQGTASTKWRSEVHGSNRKIRPQKGTGSARLGDKKSPMLKGGGVAFGPKPRDFSTKLPKKIYDLAWRTALSYRYKKGELIVLETEAELLGVHPHSAQRYLKDMLRHNRMGHADGRTLFVTLERREGLFGVLESEGMGRDARALDVIDVDVKDLLELGRVVVEKSALDFIFEEHEDDLGPQQRLGAWERLMAQPGMSAGQAAALRA